MELTSIPDAEWATVEEAAMVFWDEIAAESDQGEGRRDLQEVQSDMQKAGRPYRYG
jgi:hypothetical protein